MTSSNPRLGVYRRKPDGGAISELANLAEGSVVGRDGKPVRAGAYRKAMPTRGDQLSLQPLRLPAPGYANGGMVKKGAYAARHGYVNGGSVDREPHGLVSGPGAGTSDSVPAEVPQNTYIVPADTTEQVNLSNGEFKVAPEALMNMGAAALDALRADTHEFVGVKKGAYAVRHGYVHGGMVAKKNSHGQASYRGYADGGMVNAERDPATGSMSFSGGNVSGAPQYAGSAGFTPSGAGGPTSMSGIGAPARPAAASVMPAAAPAATPGAAQTAGSSTPTPTPAPALVKSQYEQELERRNLETSASSIVASSERTAAQSALRRLNAPTIQAAAPASAAAPLAPTASQPTATSPASTGDPAIDSVNRATSTYREIANRGYADGGMVRAGARPPKGYADGDVVAPRLGVRRRGFADGGLVTQDDLPRRVAMIPTGGYPTVTGGQRIADDPLASSEAGRNLVNAVSAVSPQAGGAVARLGASMLRGGVAAAASPAVASVAPFVPVAGGYGALAASGTPAAPAPAAAPAAAAATAPAPAQPAQPGTPAAEAQTGQGATGTSSTSADRIATYERAGQTYRDIAAMQNAGGNQPALILPDRQAERNAQFDREVLIDRASRIGGRGARAIMEMLASDNRAAGDVANTRTREIGATQRAQVQEAGVTQREQARLAQQAAIEGRKQATSDAEAVVRIGVGNQQLSDAQRTAKLNAQLAVETDPNRRAALREQILLATGKDRDQPNRFTVVPGGQSVVDGQTVREPSQVLDNQTGQFVRQGTTAATTPPAGAIQMLKVNPQMAAEFDAKYGAGAAKRALGQR